MVKIVFDVTQTSVVKILQQENATSGSINNIQCEFNLSEEYKDLNCVAVFNGVHVPIVENMCYAPELEEGKCTIGVVGYSMENDEYTLRISPVPAIIYVSRGSVTEISENETPSPSEFEKYLQTINELVNSGKLKGEKGDKGDKGIDGRDGSDGKNGQDGYTPQKGIDYFDGKDGADGLSAYEIAVKNGFKGTEEEWMNLVMSGTYVELPERVYIATTPLNGQDVLPAGRYRGNTKGTYIHFVGNSDDEDYSFYIHKTATLILSRREYNYYKALLFDAGLIVLAQKIESDFFVSDISINLEDIVKYFVESLENKQDILTDEDKQDIATLILDDSLKAVNRTWSSEKIDDIITEKTEEISENLDSVNQLLSEKQDKETWSLVADKVITESDIEMNGNAPNVFVELTESCQKIFVMISFPSNVSSSNVSFVIAVASDSVNYQNAFEYQLYNFNQVAGYIERIPNGMYNAEFVSQNIGFRMDGHYASQTYQNFNNSIDLTKILEMTKLKMFFRTDVSSKLAGSTIKIWKVK